MSTCTLYHPLLSICVANCPMTIDLNLDEM